MFSERGSAEDGGGGRQVPGQPGTRGSAWGPASARAARDPRVCGGAAPAVRSRRQQGRRSRAQSLPGASRHPAPRGRGQDLCDQGADTSLPPTSGLRDSDVRSPSSSGAAPAKRRRPTHPGTGVAGARRTGRFLCRSALSSSPGYEGTTGSRRCQPASISWFAGPASACGARSGPCGLGARLLRVPPSEAFRTVPGGGAAPGRLRGGRRGCLTSSRARPPRRRGPAGRAGKWAGKENTGARSAARVSARTPPGRRWSGAGAGWAGCGASVGYSHTGLQPPRAARQVLRVLVFSVTRLPGEERPQPRAQARALRRAGNDRFLGQGPTPAADSLQKQGNANKVTSAALNSWGLALRWP